MYLGALLISEVRRTQSTATTAKMCLIFPIFILSMTIPESPEGKSDVTFSTAQSECVIFIAVGILPSKKWHPMESQEDSEAEGLFVNVQAGTRNGGDGAGTGELSLGLKGHEDQVGQRDRQTDSYLCPRNTFTLSSPQRESWG